MNKKSSEAERDRKKDHQKGVKQWEAKVEAKMDEWIRVAEQEYVEKEAKDLQAYENDRWREREDREKRRLVENKEREKQLEEKLRLQEMEEEKAEYRRRSNRNRKIILTSGTLCFIAMLSAIGYYYVGAPMFILESDWSR